MPVNNLIGDPLSFPLLILQIEFTYAFTMRRIGIAWRIYEALLLVFIGLSLLTTAHLIAPIPYLTAEAAVNVPVAIILPILLLTWFLRGNREAGWLILPSLLPAAGQVIADIATSTQTFDWTRLSAWLQPITLGPVSLQLEDLADLGFLLAIGFVMVLRFTRISQEQARTSAELAAAREIQQQLVPVTLPEAAGCRLEAAYLPAQEVGGDFYLGLAQTDGSLIILVGDVSGKGLKAAMTGVLAIGAARTLASENLAPGPLLTRLNHEMTGSQNGGFVTCVCVRITANGAVSIANAGHVAPYWNGEEVPVESGLPLGILASIEYTETLLQLIPGDRLTLLSDGVVEAQNARRELFGFDRTRAISRHSAQTIAETAQQFGQEDDITVLTVTFQ
jgi:sigma-B regulation protein RsbU (phosphoserine phosphatase)